MTSFAKTSLRLAAGCSFALMLAINGGAALAHGHGHNGGGDQHHGFNNHNDHGGDWGGNHGWHHKHHHHHHHKSANNGPGGLGPVHGPGSSHNPIVTHPPKVPKPVVTVGPAKPPPPPHYIHHIPCSRDHRDTAWGTPISNVRDHRGRGHPHFPCSW